MMGVEFTGIEYKADPPGPTAPPRFRKRVRRPRVLAAPGMLERSFVVDRAAGEADEQYKSRFELFDILVDSAKRGERPRGPGIRPASDHRSRRRDRCADAGDRPPRS